jgi:HipA-like C-terminal domain./HipA-like N-terminal domain.
MVEQKDIYVYMDWFELEEPVFMGVLHCEVIRGKEVFSYENDPSWLKYSRFRALDPDLSEFAGKQYLPEGKSNFGLFLDSSPDRWGRTLMRRREIITARAENRPPRTLKEADFLMGIYDGNRMGALRFKYSPKGEFMDNNKSLATPPWASIRELEHASLQLEKDESSDNIEHVRWLNMLIAPGSSLGGARPKANILDEKEHLWIAKFPSSSDAKNVGAWEFMTAKMAHQCGIMTSECKAQKFSSDHLTFLTKRFDRNDTGQRIHFASAMTLLGYTDGISNDDGVSYLELAEWIMRNCYNTDQNLEQLWRRIVFNIAVSNCDDHLRNHGFILTGKGWQISPAFDINPDENGMGLKLNISEDDNSLDFDLALREARYFSLSDTRAKSILKEIKSVVSVWRKYAAECDISRSEQELVARAFRY